MFFALSRNVCHLLYFFWFNNDCSCSGFKLRFNSPAEFRELVCSVGLEAVADAVGLLTTVFEQNIGISVVGVVTKSVSINWKEKIASQLFLIKVFYLHDGISSSCECSKAYFCGRLSRDGRELVDFAGFTFLFLHVYVKPQQSPLIIRKIMKMKTMT